MKIGHIVIGILIASISVLAQAGDVAAGKTRSVACMACHGEDGIGTHPIYPNIAGQKEAYLLKSLKAYKDGTRSNELMGRMAKILSDADMENLAAYYSSLKNQTPP